MAQAPKQLSFTELMGQMKALQEQLNIQAQERVDAIKSELTEISNVTGKPIEELLGLSTKQAAPAAASGSSKGAAGKDPEIESFKADYAGKVIINPGHGNGKDYIVGSRGSFPKWIKDNMDDVRGGKFDIVSLDEYHSRGAPGEVKPE